VQDDPGGEGMKAKMRLSYDPKHNIAYFRLHEKKGQVDTVRVSDELNVGPGARWDGLWH